VFASPAAGSMARGAVYVFESRGNTWERRRVVKPEATPQSGTSVFDFGVALSLGDKGKTLVVGQPNESTLVPHPGDPESTGENSGAVWIY